MPPQPTAEQFFDYVSRKGLVRMVDLQEVVEAHKASGANPARGMLDKGFFTESQIKRVFNDVVTTAIVCKHCKRRMRVPTNKTTATLPCPGCREPISLAQGTIGFREILIENPPLRRANRILLEAVQKEGILLAAEVADLKAKYCDPFPPGPVDDVVVEAAPDREIEIRALGKKRDLYFTKTIPDYKGLQLDVELARYLVRFSLAEPDVLNKYLNEQNQRADKGDQQPLRELLLERGELSAYQLEAVLPRQFDNEGIREQVMSLDPEAAARTSALMTQLLEGGDGDEDFDEDALFDGDDDDDLDDDDDDLEDVGGGGVQTLDLGGDAEEEEEEEEEDEDAFRPGNMMAKYVKHEYGDKDKKKKKK